MEKLLQSLRARYTHIVFSAGDSFYWSPSRMTVFYKPLDTSEAYWALLHETGHALLDHQLYKRDFNLLMLELAAWQHAKLLAQEIGFTIDNDYIEDCLDTYRTWIYRRSICPRCETVSLQSDTEAYYHCFNCQNRWRVAPSRFCRPYRTSKAI